MEKATFGGGCFWCIEAAMKEIDEVKSVVSGYAGGSAQNPTYKQICKGNTGHAEVVQVFYDETTYKQILQAFFAIHNPETVNREGPDVGSQYRSIILWHDKNQKQIATSLINELESEGVYDDIVTEVTELDTFYKAEKRHQDFYEKNKNHPYCQAHIPEKLSKVNSHT